MSLYRKKPVTVEARQLADDLRSHTDIAAWIESGGGQALIPFAEPCLYIETLEGRMRADIGDWIIKDVAGEFYPRKPDIFERTYEPASGACAADVRDRPGEPGWLDVTCGACGEESGTNFRVEEIECAECEARRCPNCHAWFGGQR